MSTTTPAPAQELGTTRIARGMSPSQVAVLAETVVYRDFADGEKIIDVTDQTFDLFVLLAGHGQVRGAFNQEVNVIETGSMIGEMSFLDRRPRSAPVYSMGTSLCAVITPEVMERLREERPDVVAHLLCNISLDLCDKLRRANRLIDALSI